ncbi:hypothetical protein PT7_2513 [Pusillimonas sp. T7-7]|nr:hypothetical protein PT7_2513 [Pusillimonas sp. T7-7]
MDSRQLIDMEDMFTQSRLGILRSSAEQETESILSIHSGVAIS